MEDPQTASYKDITLHLSLSGRAILVIDTARIHFDENDNRHLIRCTGIWRKQGNKLIVTGNDIVVRTHVGVGLRRTLEIKRLISRFHVEFEENKQENLLKVMKVEGKEVEEHLQGKNLLSINVKEDKFLNEKPIEIEIYSNQLFDIQVSDKSEAKKVETGQKEESGKSDDIQLEKKSEENHISSHNL